MQTFLSISYLSIGEDPWKGPLGLLILQNSRRKLEEFRRKSYVHTIPETVQTKSYVEHF
jgi:hypothetical protein